MLWIRHACPHAVLLCSNMAYWWISLLCYTKETCSNMTKLQEANIGQTDKGVQYPEMDTVYIYSRCWLVTTVDTAVMIHATLLMTQAATDTSLLRCTMACIHHCEHASITATAAATGAHLWQRGSLAMLWIPGMPYSRLQSYMSSLVHIQALILYDDRV